MPHVVLGGGRVAPEVHRPGARLCRPHSDRLGELLYAAPDLFSWLRVCASPKLANDLGREIRDPSKPGSRPPCQLAAIDAADRLAVALLRWAQAGGLPDEFVPAGLVRHGEWITGAANTLAGMRAVRSLAGWLWSRREELEESLQVGDALCELQFIHSTSQATWGW